MDMVLGAIIGFMSGYLVGVRDGQDGYDRVRQAWKIVSASQEYKAFRSSAPKITSAMIQRGIEVFGKWFLGRE